MGLMRIESLTAGLRRFAFGADLLAFPVLGWGGEDLWREFVDMNPVRLAEAPHNADLMVLGGEIPADWGDALRALFETFTLPRGILWLRPARDCAAPPLPLTATIGHPDIASFDWSRLSRSLLNPKHAVNRPLLPDKPPAPWRDRGDYGQGGEGMMGGKPYGRPMAMTADDVDDLALDDVPLALGPFFPHWPAGLQLDLRVQGDRIRTCAAWRNHFPPLVLAAGAVEKAGPATALSIKALAGRPVRIAAVERARIESHLSWMADFLVLVGLPRVAARLRRERRQPQRETIAALVRSAEQFGLQRACAGIGRIDSDAVSDYGLSGPAARASGLGTDARANDPAYANLGFTPQLEADADVWARWRVRVRECLQSFDLIETAGNATTARPEGPRGPLCTGDGEANNPVAALCRALTAHIAGMEWSQAVLFVASLDLDMREAALV
jgi:hypothetical protein